MPEETKLTHPLIFKHAPALPETPREPARTIEWVLANVYTLARRRLHRLPPDHPEREWWQHVVRIAEESGVRQQGVLRAEGTTHE